MAFKRLRGARGAGGGEKHGKIVENGDLNMKSGDNVNPVLISLRLFNCGGTV